MSAGAGEPSAYALNGLSVMFDPKTLNVSDLALVAVAYAQASGSTVDEASIRLSVQTTLADLTAAYSNVQSALTAYEQSVTAAADAAGAYSMGTGTKANWYNALSASANSQVSLYSALSTFTQQANALNDLTGGWVSRNQGWLSDSLLPLYNS